MASNQTLIHFKTKKEAIDNVCKIKLKSGDSCDLYQPRDENGKFLTGWVLVITSKPYRPKYRKILKQN